MTTRPDDPKAGAPGQGGGSANDDVRRRVHGFVRGRVQGVWFRGSMQEQAERLGLGGWVRNLPDGRLEFAAEGDPRSLDAFVDWTRRGPPAASVADVSLEDQPPAGEATFDVRATPRG